MPLPDEASAALLYHLRNKEHLSRSGPRYPKEFFEESFWKQRLAENIELFLEDRHARFFIYRCSEDGEDQRIIGSASLNEIVRRAAQFCYLGYGLDEQEQGRGYMTEALQSLVKFAFSELNLHRIMANYIPSNERSGNVLARLGFVKEGYAKEYLYINGAWQDHVMTSLTNQQWRADRA
jgi:ribosomal-protein-alanine N-acetyltransferase